MAGGQMTPATTTTPATLVQNPMLGVNLPASSANGNPGTLALSLFNASLSRILQLELSALEKDGIGKIISSPRVITANNIKAKIEDGTEIPFITAQASSGGTTYTVSFKPAKLSLEVTPQITPEGTVRMSLLVKKEEPDWERAVIVNDFRNPPIKSSIVETTVVVENGGTVVIGGVFVAKSSDTVNKIPVLGDIPVLGWLFKTKSESIDRRELLIFITPRMMSDKMRFD
jgi:type IV pilus assembly protein PilQ